MKQTRLLMGMPITVEIVDSNVKAYDIDKVYDYFTYVDNKFSTYKDDSEITRINNGLLSAPQYSIDMMEILKLCEETRKLTDGYFNITHYGRMDPSGLVKGWAIYNAAKIIGQMGYSNYYVDAGGDIQTAGKNSHNETWKVGIRNPFNRNEIVKVIIAEGVGVATSGTAIRGQHIYNPFIAGKKITEIVSITVIGPNIYEADRFATAAFAMDKKGIDFIERLNGFEGFVIDSLGIGTSTTGFDKYVSNKK